MTSLGNHSNGIRHQMVRAISDHLADQPGDWPVPSVLELGEISIMQMAQKYGVNKEDFVPLLASNIGIDFHKGDFSIVPSTIFLEKIPISFSRKHQVLALAETNGSLPVLTSQIDNSELFDTLTRYLGKEITPVYANSSVVSAAINFAYQQKTTETDAILEQTDSPNLLEEISRLSQHDDLLDVNSRAPVIKMVNLLLLEAVKAEASDIHIQPYESSLVVRMRIDGVLFNIHELKKGLQDEIVSRVKIIGKMNIAEKRLPQDGRATVQMGDRIIDLRIASLPSSHGERIVIRILDKSARLYTLSDLGMQPKNKEQFGELIESEHGIILVTGPTGSGKSSTLYAALQEVNSIEKNILTLEDPIEYQLPGISQTQINEKKGMTFASGLRNVLRQDPDIIMVGEIRDQATAIMAIQSSLTGHLVFSTLHTNDAASAVTRLLDLGIESYLVASSVNAVLAQRLVRRVCPNCAEAYHPTNEEISKLGIDTETTSFENIRKGRGCSQCRQMGYRGRIGIFELLVMNDELRQFVQNCATAGDIKSAAVKYGMKTLAEDGITKILAGLTTPEEVLRVTARTIF